MEGMAFHFQMWIEEKINHGVWPSVRDYYSISLPGCPLDGLGQGWTLLLGCLLWDGDVNKILYTYPHQYITTWFRIKLSSSAMNTVLTVQCQNRICSHFVTNTFLPAVAKILLLLSLINHKVKQVVRDDLGKSERVDHHHGFVDLHKVWGGTIQHQLKCLKKNLNRKKSRKKKSLTRFIHCTFSSQTADGMSIKKKSSSVYDLYF